MTSSRPSRVFGLIVRVIGWMVLVAVLLIAAACPFAGRYLVVEEPIERADALVVLAGGTTSRWFEAVDLYREGYATSILLSPGYPDAMRDALRARGVRFPSDGEIIRDVMEQHGVPASAIHIMPGGYDNTADEAARAHEIAATRSWRNVIVVTSRYHTRRALYAFQRELRGSNIRVQVKGSRYEQTSADRWWRNRSELRWVVSEMQKLIAYRLGLGK